jgi:LmbE family N-acetylglucosaminyl deacetylase
MELIVDKTHPGPSEATWRTLMARISIPPMQPIHERRVVVVAPHPDDEVLGAGGLIQEALGEHCLVEIVIVTDGEASHAKSKSMSPSRLATIRAIESDVALQRLGWVRPMVTRLRLPDGDVRGHRVELSDALASILLPDDLCVAPWTSDGHPDHDATGLAALQASRAVGARALGYLVWAWHWAEPEGADIPWERCQRLDLRRRARARKRWSTGAFQSQIRPLGPAEADAAILPEPLLRRFWRPYEIYVDESGVAA